MSIEDRLEDGQMVIDSHVVTQTEKPFWFERIKMLAEENNELARPFRGNE